MGSKGQRPVCGNEPSELNVLLLLLITGPVGLDTCVMAPKCGSVIYRAVGTVLKHVLVVVSADGQFVIK